MVWKLSPITEVTPQLIASATLTVETRGEVSRDYGRRRGFLHQLVAAEGVLLVYIRHTSASLADPGERRPRRADRSGHRAAQDRRPGRAGWVHDIEGPDDMPRISKPC